MTALVPADAAALERLDPAAREVAVTQYLTDARDRLASALLATGPEAVAALKAEIATAAEATKQLGLSKEIQSDAQEMVRRAEYALGKAIRAGQERGEIRTRESNLRNVEVVQDNFDKPSPRDFASQAELSGNGSTNAGIYALVDGVSDAQFDAALSDARAEGNLSRANVVRKIKGVKQDGQSPYRLVHDPREGAGAVAFVKYGQYSVEVADGDLEELRTLVQRIADSGSFEWLRLAGKKAAEDGDGEGDEVIVSMLVGPGIPLLIWDEADDGTSPLVSPLREKYL